MAGSSSSPCAACKLLRRRCAKDCIFAPYFPPDDPHKFAIVHKVFGASNVSKMLQELPVHQRSDAVSSMVYEGNARIKDPVYGCVGAISYLQSQVSQLQMQLAVAKAEILCIHTQHESSGSSSSSSVSLANQQADFVHDEDYMIKPPFAGLHYNGGGAFANYPQLVNFSSTSSSSSASAGNAAAVQEALKREYLWT